MTDILSSRSSSFKFSLSCWDVYMLFNAFCFRVFNEVLRSFCCLPLLWFRDFLPERSGFETLDCWLCGRFMLPVVRVDISTRPTSILLSPYASWVIVLLTLITDLFEFNSELFKLGNSLTCLPDCSTGYSVSSLFHFSKSYDISQNSSSYLNNSRSRRCLNFGKYFFSFRRKLIMISKVSGSLSI